MNVLVLSHLYPRPNDPSYGPFVHRQVKQLQRLGHQITVVSPVPWSPRILHFKTKWRDYGLTPKKAVWEGVQVYYTRYLRLPGEWFRSPAGYTAYRGMAALVLRLHQERPFDIIHSNVLLPDGLAGLYLRQKLNIPLVCTVHGADAISHPFCNSLNLHYSKIVVGKADQIVVVSRALKEVVQSFAQPQKAMRVVHNGADIEKFEGPEIELPEIDQRHTASIKPYILFVGRDIRRKGLKDLLAAFVQLIDKIEHNLAVIGATPDEVKALAPDLTEALGDRLIALGCLAPDEIPSYMQNCELFVLPSYSEGLPCVVLEAMACRKAVIATDVMGIPEEVVSGVTGLLIQPGDVSGLTENIQMLASNVELSQEMGRRGEERVIREFTWEHNASKMVSVYQEAINAKTVSLKLPK